MIFIQNWFQKQIILVMFIVTLFMAFLLTAPHAHAQVLHACVDATDNDQDTYIDSGDVDCNGTWETRSSMPVATNGVQSAVVGDNIYSSGGRSTDFPPNNLTTVWKYDTLSDSWTLMAPMQEGRIAHTMESVGEKVYAISGARTGNQPQVILSSVEEYNPLTNTWTYKANMPTGRYGAFSAVLNDEIYVIGGNNFSISGPLSIMEVYNPSTNTWSTKTPPLIPVHNAAAEVVDGKLYVIGGQNVNDVSINTVQIYDPSTNSWTIGNPIPVGRISPGIAVVNGSIFVYGGHQRTTSGATYSNDVHEYVPSINQWFQRASLPTARSQFGSVAVNGSAYSIGGSTYSSQAIFHNNVEVFTPSFSEGVIPNRPPTLDYIGNKVVAEGDVLSFTVTATDPDGDNLTYSINNAPSGSTFDPITNVFTWNTGFTDAGNYTDIEISVTDDGTPMQLDVELINITVGNVNRAPEITNPGQQLVLENNPLTFNVSATDPDNDTVSIVAPVIPSGATFDGSNFSWTPSLDQEGVYMISFIATDNGNPAESSQIDVIVTVGNNPTPLEKAEDLVEYVIDLNLLNNTENSYLANLKKVELFISTGKINVAINQLNSFINKVNQDFQLNIITQQEYQSLIDAANNLINDLTN